MLATAAGVAKATQVGRRITEIIEILFELASTVLRPAFYILDPVGAAATDLGALMGSRAAIFGMELSHDTVKAAELLTAMNRLPESYQDALRLASDPSALAAAMKAGGCPQSIIDDALKNNPFRNLTPNQIVDKYWNADKGTWNWPEHSGFADGKYTTSTSLPPGTHLDRIGYPGGKFLGTQGDSYGQRALAPGSAAGGYHTYEPGPNPLPSGWEIRHGKIGEAFDHGGGGTQWVFIDKSGEEVPVDTLIKMGVLTDTTKR